MLRTTYRMIITLDPEKAITHEQSSIMPVYNAIAKIMSRAGVTVIRTGIYESEDRALIDRANDALKAETWITELIDQWLLFSPEGVEENLRLGE